VTSRSFGSTPMRANRIKCPDCECAAGVVAWSGDTLSAVAADAAVPATAMLRGAVERNGIVGQRAGVELASLLRCAARRGAAAAADHAWGSGRAHRYRSPVTAGATATLEHADRDPGDCCPRVLINDPERPRVLPGGHRVAREIPRTPANLRPGHIVPCCAASYASRRPSRWVRRGPKCEFLRGEIRRSL